MVTGGTPAPVPALAPVRDEVSNTIGRALHLFGDQWTLLILQRAFLGARRYQDWHDALKISNASLSARLKQLVAAGVLRKAPATEGEGGRHVYELSESGLGTWPIFVAIWRWERNWVSQPRPTRTELVHETCGTHDIDPQLMCARCRQPASLENVQAQPLQDLGDVERGFAPRRHRQQRSAPDDEDLLSFMAETMEILGDRWSIPLLAVAMLGLSRFSEFERALGIPPSVLSQRLRRFTELDVFTVPVGEKRERRHEYRLAVKGRAFFEVLVLLSAWGDRYVSADKVGSLILNHKPCGERLRPSLTCDACGEALHGASIRFEIARHEK